MARRASIGGETGFTVGELIVVVVLLVGLSLLAVPTIRGYLNDSPPEPETAFVVIEAPVIEGPAQVGQELLAGPGKWTPEGISFSYQWQRCSDESPCQNVGTGPRYTVQPADRGQRLRVQVTGRHKDLRLTVPSPLTDPVA